MASSEDLGHAMKFCKLNASNYRTWAFNMKLYLENQDLFDHVDGTAIAPANSTSEAQRHAFRRAAKKAWTSICLAVEPEEQIHIRETSTAKEAWDTLKEQFARQSILQKVRLRQRYYSCKFQRNGNMLQHINTLKSLYDQLREIGAEIDDQELAMTLLASLPDEFKPLITALDAVGESNLSFQKVKAMLLNDFDRNSDNFAVQKSENALFAKRNVHGRRGFQGRGRRGSVSRGAGNAGNLHADKVFTGTCHFCKERGHYARDCPKKNSRNFNHSNLNAANYSGSHDNDDNHDEALITTSHSIDKQRNSWIIDSGATQHMTYQRECLSDYVEFKNPATVSMGDDHVILAHGKGVYRLKAYIDGCEQSIALQNVWYLPELGKNLLSVKAMIDLGALIQFEGQQCKILRNSKVLGIGEVQGKLYILKTTSEQANTVEDSSNPELWHYRFGHLGMENMRKLSEINMVNGIDTIHLNESKLLCEGCVKGKQHKLPYPTKSDHRASEVLEIIHSDVCGPMNVDSYGNSRYFVTFIDDYSRYTSAYFLNRRSEVLGKFKEFVNIMSNLTGKKVKILRSDNGGEYLSEEFTEYLKEQGISHQLTVPYNPAQNGVAERMNRTVVESARCLIYHANMPLKFWAEAINTAVYQRNRSPTTALKDTTPYESFFQEKPDVANLKVFGCIAYSHVPAELRKKLDPKSKKTIFIGYPEGTKGYKLNDLTSKRFIRSRDIIFCENKFHDFEKTSFTNSDVHFSPNVVNEEEYVNAKENTEQVGETYEQRFMNQVAKLPEKRQRQPPQRFVEDDSCNVADVLTADIDEPTSLKEAINGEYSTQ